MCGRGIRSHPAHGLLRRSGWRCGWPSCGRRLVEASERVGGAAGIEHLDPRQETFGTEDAQREDRYLGGPPAGAVGEAKNPGDEKRIGLHCEDIVVADGEIVAEIEQGAPMSQELLRSACG